MRVIYSDITYDEAQKFWREQDDAMYDRKERLVKMVSRIGEIVCGLVILISTGIAWKTKVLPDILNICAESGKMRPAVAVSVSVLITVLFMAAILLVIHGVIIGCVIPRCISWLLKGTENEFDKLWESFLDDLRFQNNLKIALQKNENAPLDIQESQLILCGETDEGMYFQSIDLNGRQRSKLLAEGILDFSGADREWERIKGLFMAE